MRVARTLDLDVAEELIELTEVLGTEFDVHRCNVLFEVRQLPGAGNGHDPGLLRHHPGECDLGLRDLLSGSDLAYDIDQDPVCLTRFRGKAGRDVSEIVVIEPGALIYGACQVAFAQGAIRDETNSELLERLKEWALGIAPPERVFALHSRDALYRVGTTDRLWIRLAQTEVLHLALADQLLHGSRNLLDRNRWIYSVLVKEIDVVGLQSLERAFDNLADVLGAAVESARAAAIGIDVKAKLRGNDNMSAHCGKRLTQQRLIGEGAIELRRIEERDTQIDCGTYQRQTRLLLHGTAVFTAQPHATEPESRDFQIAEHALLHWELHCPIYGMTSVRQPRCRSALRYDRVTGKMNIASTGGGRMDMLHQDASAMTVRRRQLSRCYELAAPALLEHYDPVNRRLSLWRKLSRKVEKHFLPHYWEGPPKWRLFLRSRFGKQRTLPDFFIVGAPKSGTSDIAISTMLHPQVMPPIAKEFWSQDSDKWKIFYPTERHKQRHRERYGAALSPYCVPALHFLNVPYGFSRVRPDARVVLVLRDPVARTYSHWKWEVMYAGKALVSRHPYLGTYSKFIDSALEIFPDNCTPTVCTFPLIHTSIYWQSVRCWIECFGSRNVMVVDVADYFRDRDSCMRKIFEFVGLQNASLPQFDTVINSNPVKLPKADEATSSRLRTFFEPYNEKLWKVIGKRYPW